MKCNFCGKEIPDESKVCPFCNAELNAATENSQTATGSFEGGKSGKTPITRSKLFIPCVIIVAALVIAFLFSLPNYSGLASKEYRKGNYSAAEYCYEKANKTSGKKYTDTVQHSMADYDFLETVQSALIERYNAPEDEDLSTMVDKELYQLARFEDAEFYDKTLEKYAHDYFAAELMQKNSLAHDYDGNAYISDIEAFYNGRAQKNNALLAISKLYPILEDNSELQQLYVNSGDYWVVYGAVIKSASEMDDPVWSEEDNCYCQIFTNPTSYTINMKYTYTYITNNIETSETLDIDNLRPGASIKLLMKKAPDTLTEWTWSLNLLSAEKSGNSLTALG